MIIVAAIAAWIGLAARWPFQAIYVALLLIGAVAGEWIADRRRPGHAVWGYVIAVLPGMGLCHLGMVAPFCWLLKDGLGPDSVESSGLEAAFSFGGLMKWHLLVGLSPLILAIGLSRTVRAR